MMKFNAVAPVSTAGLWVVSVISNPIRFASRVRLYQEFEKHIIDSGAQLVTVEIAFGDRAFTVTEAGNPRHVQLRSFQELWHKENMINLGIQRVAHLDPKAEYVAWIDSDIRFTRPDWVHETVQQLQHYHVIQMFTQCHDLGPQYESLQTHEGFMSMYFKNANNLPSRDTVGGYYTPADKSRTFWHPGYAWAASIESLNAMGMLLDCPILGSADHHMAMAMLGLVTRSIPITMSAGYHRELLQWQERATKFLKRDVGYMQGTIQHYHHGPKKKRAYVTRWDVLTSNKYDPDTDIRYDWQGLLALNVESERQMRMRDGIRAYFRARDEDSTEV